MKLKLRQQILIGFMLFSLFFGAGNLIFPPFLGNQSGYGMPIALLGFIIPAVILPVLGVIIVAKFNGLENLASKVNHKFAIIFTVLILLSIGPGLGIPRAASVPFEMAIMPYLGENMNPKLFMLLYSFIFFVLVLWLTLTPSKLLKRIGYILTPSLLTLLVVLFITFFIKGNINISSSVGNYAENTFLSGFCDGYLTMDTIAALNFGLVISGSLMAMGIKKNNEIVRYTLKTGAVAGTILALIYLGLAYIGMATSGAYKGVANGAQILRNVVYSLFGDFGAIVLAAIFTLACLTTCVGLVTSISKYFSDLTKGKLSYNKFVYIIVIFSFIICNMGLDMILSISVPILNAIYPVSIVLILLGLFDRLYKDNKFIYPITVFSTGLISLIYVFDQQFKIKVVNKICSYILGYNLGFGWVSFAIISVIISLILAKVIKPKATKSL